MIDYKTGRPNGIDPDDPTAAGRMLQLPVYAHAARASFGDPDTAVGAAYWYVSTRGQFRWAELVLSPEVDARVDEVLRTIADGIDAGVFPCRVDPPTTWTRRIRSYTDPDAPRHPRPVPRVAAQADRTAAARLRRARRTRGPRRRRLRRCRR